MSVLSGAPYGYRYIRKSDEAPASYEVIEAEARVVKRVYTMYTVVGLSMGEIAHRLNIEGIPTRKQSARWERSVVWAMLRNPAYRGAACFGKTRVAGRIRLTREPLSKVIPCDICGGTFKPTDEIVVKEEQFSRYRGDDNVEIFHVSCITEGEAELESNEVQKEM